MGLTGGRGSHLTIDAMGGIGSTHLSGASGVHDEICLRKSFDPISTVTVGVFSHMLCSSPSVVWADPRSDAYEHVGVETSTGYMHMGTTFSSQYLENQAIVVKLTLQPAENSKSAPGRAGTSLVHVVHLSPILIVSPDPYS